MIFFYAFTAWNNVVNDKSKHPFPDLWTTFITTDTNLSSRLLTIGRILGAAN